VIDRNVGANRSILDAVCGLGLDVLALHRSSPREASSDNAPHVGRQRYRALQCTDIWFAERDEAEMEAALRRSRFEVVK
jgi:hypothetical protein